MINSKPSISEKQARADERQKVYAEVAGKLVPPFSKTYLAKDVFGLNSKQQLTNYINKFKETK